VTNSITDAWVSGEMRSDSSLESRKRTASLDGDGA
jgi:hypothetical protein